MANLQKQRGAHRLRKMRGVRRRLRQNSSRPRLTVFRSLKNIYCQIIDDEAGRTLVSASSRDKDIRGSVEGRKRVEAASVVGGKLAERALAAGVKQVAFDRGPFKFHGRVKALASAAREGGLEF